MTRTEMLKRKEILIKKQQKEYATRGNTQYCQNLFKEIQQIEEQLNKRSDNS